MPSGFTISPLICQYCLINNKFIELHCDLLLPPFEIPSVCNNNKILHIIKEQKIINALNNLTHTSKHIILYCIFVVVCCCCPAHKVRKQQQQQ